MLIITTLWLCWLLISNEETCKSAVPPFWQRYSMEFNICMYSKRKRTVWVFWGDVARRRPPTGVPLACCCVFPSWKLDLWEPILWQALMWGGGKKLRLGKSISEDLDLWLRKMHKTVVTISIFLPDKPLILSVRQNPCQCWSDAVITSVLSDALLWGAPGKERCCLWEQQGDGAAYGSPRAGRPTSASSREVTAEHFPL